MSFLIGRYNVEMLTETDSNRKMAIVCKKRQRENEFL